MTDNPLSKTGHDELRVSTTPTEIGVVQQLDVRGEISYRFANLCAKLMDDAIRAKLVELGWTPPGDVAGGG
jgi:hypothetical protein